MVISKKETLEVVPFKKKSIKQPKQNSSPKSIKENKELSKKKRA